MDEDKIYCCGICLPAIIAQDDRVRTVRALSIWDEVTSGNCQCENQSEFELSR